MCFFGQRFGSSQQHFPIGNTNVLQNRDCTKNEEYVVGQIFKKSNIDVLNDVYIDVTNPDSNLTSLGTNLTESFDEAYDNDTYIKTDGIEYIAGYLGKKYSSDLKETVRAISSNLASPNCYSSWVHQLS
jgi:87kDa Transposase